VGGDFTRLDLRGRLAALDLVTGAVKRDFVVHVEGAVDPESSTRVSALEVVEDQATSPPTRRLVVGGNFSQINSPSNNRSGLAAVTLDRGVLDGARFTTSVAGGPVLSMALGANALYVGGAFTQFGSQRTSLVALNFAGSRLSGSFSSQGDPVLDLSLSEDGTVLAGAIGGLSNRAMSWVASGSSRGSQRWRARRVLGDVQAVHCLGEHVYFGFHDGMFAEPDPYKLAAMEMQSGAFAADVGTCNPADEYDRDGCWLPVMDDTMWQGFFGIWAIEHFVDPRTGATRMIVGGDFTRVGNVRASRLAFLTRLEPAPTSGDIGEATD
jgi:hypothetical protein